MKVTFKGLVERLQPATVQERLLLLLALAVAPIGLLGILLALQNYATLAEVPQRRVELIHRAAAARYGALLDNAVDLVESAATLRTLASGEPATCEAALHEIVRLEHQAFHELTVVNARGQPRCSTSGPPHLAPDDIFLTPEWRSWFQAGAPATRLVLTPTGPKAATLAAASKFSTELDATNQTVANAPGAALVATLRIEWLTRPDRVHLPEAQSHSWLLDRLGHILPLSAPDEGAFPNDHTLDQIRRSIGPILLSSANGTAYAYQASTIRDGLTLLVGTNAEADIAMAERRLGVRFAEIGAFLLAGLVGVAFGANAGVVEPVRRLSAAVRRWRAGGTFDPTPPARAPTEIRELALSFSQATASLVERERQLRNASTQQDLLMQEIHHRVKNNLQIIASLLNLQASRIRQPSAKAEFQSARDRIRALATLHRHLYAHNELHTINMRSFLNELCGQLVAAIGDRPGDRPADAAGERISLQIDAPELQISSDQAVPIALIVTEAVSNAAKYAFPGGRTGHIFVKLTTEQEGDATRARLTIRDDGVGIPAGRAETETGVRDGIGIQLIRGFARQLGAKLLVTEENGTSYTLDIPLRRERNDAANTTELVSENEFS